MRPLRASPRRLGRVGLAGALLAFGGSAGRARAEEARHDGIPIAALQALHQEEGRPPQTPDFGTAETGWALLVPQGLVFVFVGRDAAEAEAWTALQLRRQRKPTEPVLAPVEGVEAAWRRTTEFALLRDDNVGIMVQGTPEATEEAALVRSLIQDQGLPWPAPPQLKARADGSVELVAPGSSHLSYQGGRRRSGQGLVFDEAPRRAVAWDELGRAAVWSAESAPEAPAPAPPAPEAPAPEPPAPEPTPAPDDAAQMR